MDKKGDLRAYQRRRSEKTRSLDSKLLNTVSQNFSHFFMLEPAAVQQLTRKLEQSLRQIEIEVTNLADQVKDQDNAIKNTV